VLPERSNDHRQNSTGVQGRPGASTSSASAESPSFAESQQAGIAAAITLARTTATDVEAWAGTSAAPSPDASLPREAAADVVLAEATLPALRSTQFVDQPTETIPLRAISSGTTSDTSFEGVRERPVLANWATRVPWPLVAILLVQAAMGLRLIWSNTAFIDEATYLYAGSQELHHWLLGVPVQDYQTFLSGSPALYPPIGAVANAIGGLAAARILSLLFMLGTTSLLYATTHRLFGKAPAVLGTATFAGLGVTQFLSAFATYDPLALFLVALATYFTIGRHNDGSLGYACLSGVVAPLVLALANATKYATGLWDPIIIGLAACLPVTAGYTWRYGLKRAGQFTVVLALVLGIGLAMGNAKYIHGILFTTVNRSSTMIGMGQSAELVLHRAWAWAGAVFVMATVGMIALMLPKIRPMSIVAVLLLLATFAAPVDQAVIGTSTSLQKHVVFGAWFGCILVGVALARLLRHKMLIVIGGAALIVVLPIGFANQAWSLYHSWPEENPAFIRGLKAMVHPGQERYLIEGYSDIPAYYVGPSVNSLQWNDIGTFSGADPASGTFNFSSPVFARAIRQQVFTLIIVGPSNDSSGASSILAAIKEYDDYHIVGHLPPATIGSHSAYTVWRVDSSPRQIA
jgi:hypothetical protein